MINGFYSGLNIFMRIVLNKGLDSRMPWYQKDNVHFNFSFRIELIKRITLKTGSGSRMPWFQKDYVNFNVLHLGLNLTKRIALNEDSRMLRYWRDNVNFNSYIQDWTYLSECLDSRMPWYPEENVHFSGLHSGLNLFKRIALGNGVWIRGCPGIRKTRLIPMNYIQELSYLSELHWARVWIQRCPGTRTTTLTSTIYIQNWTYLSGLHWTSVRIQGCHDIRKKKLISMINI